MTDHSTRFGHCSGCTDPSSEGTHQLGTHEHPEEVRKPLLSDDGIGKMSVTENGASGENKYRMARRVRQFYEYMIARGELEIVSSMTRAEFKKHLPAAHRNIYNEVGAGYEYYMDRCPGCGARIVEL